jgi:predicted DNA-binding ArsR family transcriptional regulator
MNKEVFSVMATTGSEPVLEQGKGPRIVQCEETIQSILAALEDAGCRRILEETTKKPLTTSEISNRCHLPLSTSYRKVHTLTEAGLLAERTRLPRSGKKTKEYSHSIQSVTVPVDAGGGDPTGILIRTSSDDTEGE